MSLVSNSLMALLLFSGPGAPGNDGPLEGTPAWHYSPFNTAMKAGHKKIRAWRKQIEDKRRASAVSKLRDIQEATPAGGVGTFPAPEVMGTQHSFADGRLEGAWRFNQVTNETAGEGYGAGVRLDRTVYDPVNNRLFALTTERNLVDAPFEHEGAWTTRNQVIKVEKKSLEGVVVPAGTNNNNEDSFRLIGAIDTQLCYSDDEGLNWTFAAGGEHAWYGVGWVDVMANGDILAQARITEDGPARYDILRSRDYGESYELIASWSDASTGGLVGARLYNTDDTVFIVREDDDNDVWEIYRYDGEELLLVTTFDSPSDPETITGTSFGGEKIYVGVNGGGGYYSDGGLVWEWREFLPQRIETVHPNAPDLLFSHEPQHDYSLDGGWTWEPYPNQNETIGWDPKHLTFHFVAGQWVFVGANDMGLCFNEDVLDTSTWQYINNEHDYAILHGGVAVDHRGLTVTANQDPGTFELLLTGPDSYQAINRVGADGLRVVPSNDGRSYWYRHYWSDFYHSHAAFTGDERLSALPIVTDDWYTPPFVSSKVVGEDAIYVSGYDKIFKLVYDTDSNFVQRLELPTDFGGATGSVTYGIGIAKSEPSRIYVATKNGRFFYSSDWGENWNETSYEGVRPEAINKGYSQEAGLFIEVADLDPDRVYFGGGSGEARLLISKDGGVTFEAAIEGLPANESLGGVSLNPEGTLAFSANYHVYVAAEDQWHEMKGESMPTGAQPNALSLNYLRLQNKVRYFTWGAGVLDFELSTLDFEDQPLVEFDAEACYSLRATHTDMALQADAASGNQGAQASQGEWTDLAEQKWQFTRELGFFHIYNFASGDHLAVLADDFVEGASVYAFTSEDEEEEEGHNADWNVLLEPNGAYVLASRYSAKALSVGAASEVNGAAVKQWTYHKSPHQQWTIAEVSCESSTAPDDEGESGEESGEDSGEGEGAEDTGESGESGDAGITTPGSGCNCSVGDAEDEDGGREGLMLLLLAAMRRRRR